MLNTDHQGSTAEDYGHKKGTGMLPSIVKFLLHLIACTAITSCFRPECMWPAKS